MKAGFSSRALLNNGRVSLIGGVLLLCAAGVAAQEHRAPGGPELPSSAEEWINSVPLTYDNLQGKGVVFWYFEEECPSCAAKWPSFKELAAQHAADPVLFVAVNSGNSPEAVKKYARQHSVNWPIIVDTARKFEAASDVGTISLENISQVCILTADGRFRRGRWDDLAGSVQTALTGAEWSLDPQQFAPAAREAVRCVEFGAYAAAVQKIRAGYKDASQDARQSFKQLAEIVNNRFAAAWREAEESVTPRRSGRPTRCMSESCSGLRGCRCRRSPTPSGTRSATIRRSSRRSPQ